MPIYAYRCSACGHAKDVLQKIADAPLTVCPQCGADAFAKQVTAAGFQLKGSGWYVTDFRGGGTGAKPTEKTEGKPAEGKPAEGKPAEVSAPAPAAAPAAASGSTGS